MYLQVPFHSLPVSGKSSKMPPGLLEQIDLMFPEWPPKVTMHKLSQTTLKQLAESHRSATAPASRLGQYKGECSQMKIKKGDKISVWIKHCRQNQIQPFIEVASGWFSTWSWCSLNLPLASDWGIGELWVWKMPVDKQKSYFECLSGCTSPLSQRIVEDRWKQSAGTQKDTRGTWAFLMQKRCFSELIVKQGDCVIQSKFAWFWRPNSNI